MKAIVVHEFGGPEVLKVEEIEDPKPGPGQVLIEVRAIGVNPVEVYTRAGKTGAVPLPYIPGSDAAGVVAEVGKGVEGFKPGDRVYTTVQCKSAYAEKIASDHTAVFPLPERISFQEGAAIGVPCGAAWRALFVRGRARGGETVLVHGASGMVGLAAVQLAHSMGMQVIGTASTEEGRRAARESGAAHVADHEEYDKIADAAPGGVALILEMAADRNLGKDLKALAKHGRVIVIGSHGPVEIEPRAAMGSELDIRGMTIRELSLEDHRAMYCALTAALESGVLRPLIAKEIRLVEAAEAHRLVEKGDLVGKLVLTP